VFVGAEVEGEEGRKQREAAWVDDCEAAGNGDSGLYPGAGADTGAMRVVPSK